MSQLSGLWLAAGGVMAALWSWGGIRRRKPWAAAAAVLLWAALGVAAGVQLRLGEIARDWPGVEREIEEEAAAALNARLDDLVGRGERAVEGAAAQLAVDGKLTIPQLFRRLRGLREEAGVSALALFDADGTPLAWAGEHRGSVPPRVRQGALDYVFEEGPLFSYLYFARPLPGGRTAVAAALLEANLDVREGVLPFAERFEERYGITPRFSLPARARGETIWDWSTDRPILSVTFAALTQQTWWERVVERGRRGVGVIWLSGLVLLSIAWYRSGAGTPGVPVAVGTIGLALAPLGEVLGADFLFSPLQFVLPVPGDVTLGLLLVLAAGASLWLLTRSDSVAWAKELPLWLRLALAAPLFPLALLVVESSAAGGLLASRPGGGLPLQLAATLLLTLPLYLLLPGGRGAPPARRRVRGALLALGLLLSALLAVAVVVLWRPDRELLPWSAAAWVVPLALFSLALSGGGGRWSGARAWLAAGWLAGSVALPHLWVQHTGAELENAEQELSRLGTEADPFLDFLLRQFAERARFLAREGEGGVNLLYRSWVASGLAREGYEARISLWRGEAPETELRLSALDSIPEMVPQLVAEVREGDEPVVHRFTEIPSLHYLLLVPLPGGEVISVAVPPLQQLGRATALARFLQPASEAEAAAHNEQLYLLALPPGTTPAGSEGVEWVPADVGWRSEAWAHFPSGWMHAHLFVRTPPLPLVIARALLAQVALLGILALLWLGARLLCGELGTRAGVGRRWVRSFRGRLTVALFAFFLLPTAAFGAVAYGAVTREVIRSAASLALRTLERVTPQEVRGRLAQGSAGAEVDLLLYREGVLVDAAAPEVLDLALFHSWLPPEVYLGFAGGLDTEALEERRLGENEYLVAYRRFEPGVVLAAPIPLASDEITRRQRQFRDLALLVSLLGAALSVVLSLLVGRALARPIDELSRAAGMVGSGNLRIQLPEERPDEFGSVYRSFNRMVQRLRRARTALVRETRRTEAIVTEAATGVLALDAAGRVELVNPRAAAILGTDPARGEPLPRTGPLLVALAGALGDFRRARSVEAGRELEVDGRIVRLRLRKLTGAEGVRGTVVALEDVTAEVRTARVLAWGEMAQQVAHEIKNPLTPIKLSVQHIRRAFADRRSDFGEILERNVAAILQEIDRLGDIARAFARFGTPQQAAVALETVDVGRAIRETLALYRSGGGSIRYRVDLESPEALRATARTGELKEVLVNLLENAREALDGGGEITISAAPTPDRRWVQVEVADTGEGIPPELLPRIFEPHFSTRTSGTGLGLAIVRRMVESWGAEIEATSEPGVGTQFRIRLAADGAGPGAPPPPPVTPAEKNSGTST